MGGHVYARRRARTRTHAPMPNAMVAAMMCTVPRIQSYCVCSRSACAETWRSGGTRRACTVRTGHAPRRRHAARDSMQCSRLGEAGVVVRDASTPAPKLAFESALPCQCGERGTSQHVAPLSGSMDWH